MSYLIVRPVKSRGVAALLVFLFWPLGMFYSTLAGAFIMSFVIGPLVLWASLSSGLSLILLPLFFLVCLIWAIQAVNNYNRKILNEAAFYNQTLNNQQTNRNTENSIANIENKTLQFQRDLNQIKYLFETNVINHTQYQEQKIRIESKIYDLENNYEVKTENEFEIPVVKKSNTPIILGMLMIIIFIFLSLYDIKTNSIKFDKISSLFSNKDSKEKEIIKTELEKTYFNVLNGKYTAQNFTGGVESPFYNTNVNTLMVMGLGPIATFTGNLKVEPSNIDVYEINENNNIARLKYDIRLINKEDTVNGNIEMDAKKIGGLWKFNADKFFGLNKNKSALSSKVDKSNIQRNNSTPKETQPKIEKNTFISRNFLLPENRNFSIFYIDSEEEILFDEFLIIGDTIYFNRDIYNDLGDIIDERIVKKMYRIKDDSDINGSSHNQYERQFSLYDIDGKHKLANVIIESSQFERKGSTDERVYEWKINWIENSESETYKTSLYTSKN